MSTHHRITPESQPVFPCWLHHPLMANVWLRNERAPTSQAHRLVEFLLDNGWTHWHPDQPTAPTVTPDAANPAQAESELDYAQLDTEGRLMMERDEALMRAENLLHQITAIHTNIRNWVRVTGALNEAQTENLITSCLLSHLPKTAPAQGEPASMYANMAEKISELERELNEAKAKEQGYQVAIENLRQQLAQVEKERDEAREQWRMSSVCRELQDKLTAAESKCAALTSELAALRLDRERYGYLRNGCTLWLLSTGQWELTTKEGEFIGPDLDTLLDAARQQREGL